MAKRISVVQAPTGGNTWIQPVVSVVLLLLVWQGVASFIVRDKLFLASPLQVFDALVRVMSSQSLMLHLYTSVLEFTLGFSFALLCGVGLGVLWGVSPRWDGYIDPIVSGAYSAPLIALSPLFILWFGIGIWSKIVLVFMVAFFPILINTVTGIRSVDRNLVEVVWAFGATPRQVLSKVRLPASLPFILTGVRLGVGRALNGIVIGELFGARAGIGYMISQAALNFDTATMFLGVLIFIVGGALLTEAIKAVQAYLAPWRKEEGL